MKYSIGKMGLHEHALPELLTKIAPILNGTASLLPERERREMSAERRERRERVDGPPAKC